MNRATAFTIAVLLVICPPSLLGSSPDPGPSEEPRAPKSARDLAQDLSRQAFSLRWSRMDSADIVGELIVIDTLAAALGDEGWAARHNVVHALTPFVDEYPDARDRLVLIREDTGAVFAANRAPFGSDASWIDSNIALGGVRNVLTWVEMRCGAPQDRRALGRVSLRVIEVLIENERYDLLECVPPSLLSHAEVNIKSALMMLQRAELADDDRAQPRRFNFTEAMRKQTIERAAHTVGALHAAALVSGQPEVAQRIADLLLADLDHPESRISLATHAQRAGVADEQHEVWMREGVAQRDLEQATRPDPDPLRLDGLDLDEYRRDERGRGRIVSEPPY